MKKRILLVLPVKQSTVLTGLSRALKFLNWEVRVFDYRQTTLEEKFLNLTHQRQSAQNSMNMRLELAVKSFRPSILFTVKGELIYPETLSSIHNSGVLTVNWFPDDIQLYDFALIISSNYDIFMHFDSYALSQLKKDTGDNHYYHFRFAADILPSDPPPPNQPRPYNLTLIGNPYPHRVRNLPKLIPFGLNLWGSSDWKKTRLKDCYHGFLPFFQVNTILQQSKIGLNMQFESPCYGLVNRAYDVAKAGAMLINDDRKEFSQIYDPSTEAIVYRDLPDLYDKVNYYIRHDKIRLKIAENGYRKVSLKNTYIHRFTELFRDLKV